jgi:hypothetical protein
MQNVITQNRHTKTVYFQGSNPNGLPGVVHPYAFQNGGILDEQIHMESARNIVLKSVVRPIVTSK